MGPDGLLGTNPVPGGFFEGGGLRSQLQWQPLLEYFFEHPQGMTGFEYCFPHWHAWGDAANDPILAPA